MKKYLVGGIAATAAATLALSLPAQADEMEDMGGVSISGYMNHDFGFGSYVGGGMAADDFHQEIDAELTFKATGTTDGGLTVTATMEVDADSGAGVDESNLAIAGGFGTIILGAQDDAGNRHGNKGIGGGYGGGGYYDCGKNWMPASCPGPVHNSDALGIQYDTPNIGGLQAGVSFQAEDGNEGATTTGNDKNVIAVGANFSGDFAGTSLTLGANHVSRRTGGADSRNVKTWGLGASAGFGGTTLSLRYDAKPDHAMNAMGTGMADRSDYGVGVDHTIGALSFGIGYGSSTHENAASNGVATTMHYTSAEATARNTELDAVTTFPAPPDVMAGDPDPLRMTDGSKMEDTKHTVLSAGMTYDLGGGVKVSFGIHSGKVENQQVAGGPVTVYSCADDANTPVEGAGNACYTKASLASGYYVDTSGDNPVVRQTTAGATGVGTEITAVADTFISQSTATYSVEDLDDVGVGLRIAFSF